MDNKVITSGTGEKDSFIICRNSQGTEVRAAILRLTRYLVVFEVYNPYSILQLSEVLSEFKVVMNDRLIYSGRAIISNIVNTGIILICEATLEDSWLDVNLFSPLTEGERLQTDFAEFLKEWEKIYQVKSDFKVVVADMQTLLMDLKRWLEQVELGIRSEPSRNRLQMEKEVLDKLHHLMMSPVSRLFQRFEEIAGQIHADIQPIHRAYVKRQLHPLVLCAPFVYRTFQKPLGYAGDYEMVNMMLRDPMEGSSLFAKMVNQYFLSQPPVLAHRNRIQYLTQTLINETSRVARRGRIARIFNLGCGPAVEVQHFLVQEDLSERAQLTLLDFNDETIEHTGKLLDEIKMKGRRMTAVQLIKKSVHQILKETARPKENGPKYDLVYCAGLFDYLSERICKRLVGVFYDLLAPGGLLVVTNVDSSNPIRNMMEYFLEWHLTYRNRKELECLAPDLAPPGTFAVKADSTGVNIYLEVRKPPSE
ncbi:MAG: class I SAM-dependent methyltransferase [Chloroflexi bacterium]|nr:class I SAM-dependent methyltransferase [Chloroflexota bacterium]